MKDGLRRLREWSRHRPTAGGICLVISAIFISLPSLNGFRIGDMILTVSTISGVSTVWLAVLMALCAVSSLFWLHTRVLAGLSAMVIALVAFPAANFGGYVLGTLFGIVGASLVLAWRPLPAAEEAAADEEGAETSPEPATVDAEAPTEPQTAVIEPVLAPEPGATETTAPLPVVDDGPLGAHRAPTDRETIDPR